MPRRQVVALAVACWLVLIACESNPSEPAAAGSPALPTHRDLGSAGPAALQRGTIVATGQCVVLEEAVQHLKWVILWPPGYSYRAPAILDDRGIQIAQLGEIVDLVGGEYHDAQYEFLKTLLVTEPLAACRGGDYWLATSLARS